MLEKFLVVCYRLKHFAIAQVARYLMDLRRIYTRLVTPRMTARSYVRAAERFFKTSLMTFQGDRQTDRFAKGWYSYAE